MFDFQCFQSFWRSRCPEMPRRLGRGMPAKIIFCKKLSVDGRLKGASWRRSHGGLAGTSGSWWWLGVTRTDARCIAALPALEAPCDPEADKSIRIGPRPASMRWSGGAFGRGLPAHRVAHGSARMQWVRPAPAGNIRVAVSARLNRADVRKWGISHGTGDPGCRR